MLLEQSQLMGVNGYETWGAFFWGYSGYTYSGLGITEYTEFQFRKECYYMFQIWKRNRRWSENYNFFNRKPAATGVSGRVGFPAKNFPKRTRIVSIEQNERNDIPFIPKTE